MCATIAQQSSAILKPHVVAYTSISYLGNWRAGCHKSDPNLFSKFLGCVATLAQILLILVILPSDVRIFSSPSPKLSRMGNSLRFLYVYSQKLKPGTKLRQTASLLGEPFLQTTNLLCPWGKFHAVHCILFCACLHFVAGN